VIAVVVVALFAARESIGDPIAWSIGGELGVRLLSALYTAGIGVLMAIPLRWAEPVCGFPTDRSVRRF